MPAVSVIPFCGHSHPINFLPSLPAHSPRGLTPENYITQTP